MYENYYVFAEYIQRYKYYNIYNIIHRLSFIFTSKETEKDYLVKALYYYNISTVHLFAEAIL